MYSFYQSFAQVPNLHVLYGPDTYMGANIKELFKQMTLMSDDEIGEIHREHNRESIRSLLSRLSYYEVIYSSHSNNPPYIGSCRISKS